jgi:hypothetical protein
MLGLDALDVVIGVVFVFLLASLLATAAAEIVEAAIKRRGKYLWEGIGKLLGDEDLLDALYRHPLIRSLYQGAYGKRSRNLPSYIPSATFALALLDVTKNDMSKPVGQALRILTRDVKDLEQARKNVADWYDGAMDRVSGWYKRNTQWALFFIGLVLAAAMNIDTIAVVKELSTNKAKRDAVVGMAIEYQKAHPQPAATGTTPAGSSAPAEDLSKAQKNFDAAKTALDTLGLPIGWEHPRNWPWTPFGWLLTALAVSLGAPFWFDVLDKIVVVRSTVKPKEKSQPEPPK